MSLNRIHSGTLILVGLTVEGITIASDGLSRNGEDRAAQKIFPIGECGAIAFAGETKIVVRRERDGKIVEELDLVALSQEWISAHPELDIRNANTALADEVKTRLMELSSKYSKAVVPPKPEPFFHTIVTGYVRNEPVTLTSSFRTPLNSSIPATVELSEPHFEPGTLLMYSSGRVCNELIENATDKLKVYKADPAIVLFRRRKRLLHGSKWTLRELLAVSDVCLRATESEEGREFDTDALNVDPPNRFATITPKRCFRWEDDPSLDQQRGTR